MSDMEFYKQALEGIYVMTKTIIPMMWHNPVFRIFLILGVLKIIVAIVRKVKRRRFYS